MKTLMTRVQRFLTSEDGPTAVEYAVMLALIIVACIAVVRTIGTNAQQTFTDVGEAMTSSGG